MSPLIDSSVLNTILGIVFILVTPLVDGYRNGSFYFLEKAVLKSTFSSFAVTFTSNPEMGILVSSWNATGIGSVMPKVLMTWKY